MTSALLLGPITKPTPTKKKKSSCVARERRTQINQTLCELGSLLCPDQDRLDKLTVVRLAAATFKLHGFLKNMDQNRPCQRLQHQRPSLTRKFAKILDGFVIILSASGQVLYVSDSIKESLEHSPHNIVGEYIHSLVHPEDHNEITQNLVTSKSDGPSQNRKRRCTKKSSTVHHRTSDQQPVSGEVECEMEVDMGGTPHLPCGFNDINTVHSNPSLRVLHPLSKTIKRRFFCRMKCLQQRRFKRLVKSWGYKTVFCSGYQMYETKEGGSLSCKGFIGHVRPLQPPAIFDIPLVDGSFMTHHSLDMNYIFTDKRLQTALGYLPEEVLGKSIYSFVHNDDLERLSRFHKNLLDKGECISGYYRLALHNNGGWVTVQSQANIIYNKKEHVTPDYIVSVNYIIGQTSPVVESAQTPGSNTGTLNRSNVVLETVPKPVQITELIDSGLFCTNTGESAVPSQITRHLAPVPQRPATFYPPPAVPTSRDHHVTYPTFAPQPLYNPPDSGFVARDHAVAQPVRVPLLRDVARADLTSSYQDQHSTIPYFPSAVPSVEILDQCHSMRLGPPTTLYPSESNFAPHNVYLQNNTFQYNVYLQNNPSSRPNPPIQPPSSSSYLGNFGNYLRYLEDDHIYYESTPPNRGIV